MRDGVSHQCHTEIGNVARPAGLEPATPGLEGRTAMREDQSTQWVRLMSPPAVPALPSAGARSLSLSAAR